MERADETARGVVGGLVGSVDQPQKRTHRKPKPIQRQDILTNSAVVVL